MKKYTLETIGYVDDQLVEKADKYTGSPKKNPWVRWGTIAACFALVAVLGIVGFQRGLFGTKNETITMENGESITFVKGNVPMASIDKNITSRALNNEEITLLFAGLPVTANACFDAETHNIVGLEGEIDKGKLVVSINGMKLSDTVVEGDEYTSTINGTEVKAGYFVTKANSKGIKTSIYYASVTMGGNNIYVEFAGNENESEILKKDLTDSLRKLIENGEFDLSIIQE